MENEKETNDSDLEEAGNNNEEKKSSYKKEGGLYSKIPKNKKSIRAVTIMVIVFGFVFLGLIVLGVVLQR